MPNTAPYEIILTAPYTLFRAPVGTTFPDVSLAVDDVPDPWVKIGSAGNLNYDRDAGVTVEHRQSTYNHRALGDAGVRKQVRTEADQILRIVLNDLTPEQYAMGLNDNEVRTVGNTKRIGLSYGFQMASYALLVKGDISPLGPTGKMQYEVPIVSQQGSSVVAFGIGKAAGITLEWMSLVDASADRPDKYFGELVIEIEPT
jgi:hypothetical protein